MSIQHKWSQYVNTTQVVTVCQYNTSGHSMSIQHRWSQFDALLYREPLGHHR